MKKIRETLMRWEMFYPKRDSGAHVLNGIYAWALAYVIFSKLTDVNPHGKALGITIIFAIGWEVLQSITKTGESSFKDICFTILPATVNSLLLEIA